jgi:hypothetical protein
MFFFLCCGGILIYVFIFVWYMNTVGAQANFARPLTEIWYLFDSSWVSACSTTNSIV